jgi:sugar lactone lactonase YvrE
MWIGAGEIAILGPDGALRGRIKTNGSQPNNVAFGGTDGRTLFITQRSGGFLEHARVDRPGREFCLQAGAADPRCVVGGTGSRTR